MKAAESSSRMATEKHPSAAVSLPSIRKALRRFACRWLLEPLTSPQKLVLFSSEPDVSDNALAMFLYCHSRLANGWRLAWLVDDPDRAHILVMAEVSNMDSNRVCFIRRQTLGAVRARLAARLIFDTHGESYGLRRHRSRQTFVSLWHGNPLKRVGASHDPSYAAFGEPDYLCISSPKFWPYLFEGLRLECCRPWISGLPRNDWLTGALAGRRCSAIPLEPFVLWMPTYARSVGASADSYLGIDSTLDTDSLGCVRVDQLATIDAALDAIDACLVIKLHPYDARNSLAWPSLRHVVIVKADDEAFFGSALYTMLAASRGLISDKSSAIFDFLLLSRPVAIDTTAFASFVREDYFDIFAELPELHGIADCKDLIEFVDECVNGPVESLNVSRATEFNIPQAGSYCAAVLDCLASDEPDIDFVAESHGANRLPDF